MISESELKKDFAESNISNTINCEIVVEKIYEIIELDYMKEIVPNYEIQDEKSTQEILEVRIILFWGILASISTFLWLYFHIDRIINLKGFRYIR
jgi:hypothetical protein